jgi:hypothetical protein
MSIGEMGAPLGWTRTSRKEDKSQLRWWTRGLAYYAIARRRAIRCQNLKQGSRQGAAQETLKLKTQSS